MSLVEIKYTNYLDNQSKQYKKILVVNMMPTDTTFASIIKRVVSPRLSIFEPHQPTNCKLAIMNPTLKSEFLELSKIGLLFDFLTSNNFNLHTAFSDVIKNNTNFICYVSK